MRKTFFKLAVVSLPLFVLACAKDMSQFDIVHAQAEFGQRADVYGKALSCRLPEAEEFNNLNQKRLRSIFGVTNFNAGAQTLDTYDKWSAKVATQPLSPADCSRYQKIIKDEIQRMKEAK